MLKLHDDPPGPWLPFWMAVRQAAEDLREARAAAEMSRKN